MPKPDKVILAMLILNYVLMETDESLDLKFFLSVDTNSFLSVDKIFLPVDTNFLPLK